MKVVIDRSKWDVYPNKKPGSKLYEEYELEASPDSGMLLNGNTGLQCCLGFVGNVCGFSTLELMDKGEPLNFYNVETEEYDSRWPKELLHSKETTELISTNDANSLSNKEREDKIIELGRAVNIEFEFVGEYLS